MPRKVNENGRKIKREVAQRKIATACTERKGENVIRMKAVKGNRLKEEKKKRNVGRIA